MNSTKKCLIVLSGDLTRQQLHIGQKNKATKFSPSLQLRTNRPKRNRFAKQIAEKSAQQQKLSTYLP